MVLREKVYQVIKERIVTGKYRPGEPLNEKAIIEELNVSRTPFREAINALNEENLVQIYANRGIFVRDISAKDIANIFDVRYQLEPYVANLACVHMPQTVINTLRRRAQDALSGDYRKLLEEDDNYHKTLLDYTDNEQLKRIMLNLYEQNSMQIIMYDTENAYISEKRIQAARDSIGEHLVILSCIEKRDHEGAMENTRKHLTGARQRATA